MTNRYQFITGTQYNANDWENPTTGKSTGYGLSKYMSFEQFDIYDFVHEDSVKIVFSAEDATGQWLDCDLAKLGSFERCFYAPVENDLAFDENGSIYSRGVVSTKSPPISFYGKRCLSLTLKTEGSITVSVEGELTSSGARNQYFLERRYYDGNDTQQFRIELGMDDNARTLYQQFINLEIINHDSTTTTFVRSKLHHGKC